MHLSRRYDVMKSCWEEEPAHRPSFNTLHSQMFEISGRYTPLPALDDEPSYSTPAIVVAGGSGHSTPRPRNGPIQHVSSVQPLPQYVPVPTGSSEVTVSDRKNSGVSLGSIQRSRDSLQPDKLSITFSVLSGGDVLGEGDESSRESSEGEEEDEEREVDMIAPELLDRFMPSLRMEQRSSIGDGTSTEDSSRPMLTLTSPSVSGMGNDLEDTLKYTQLPSSALSPGPFSTSTMTSRLSPCETQSCSSSQYGPSTVRSDDTPVPGVSSPSPDLTSKTSTIGDETLSIASNTPLAGAYHMHSTPVAGAGTGALSKTSTVDSVSPTGISDYSHTPNLVYSPHVNGSQCSGREHRTVNHDSSLTNGHPPGKANGDVIRTVQSSPPISSLSDHGGGPPAPSAEESPLNGVVLRDSVNNQMTSRDSRTSQTSFGLGLGDLSSDLLSAFDSWK